MIQLTIINGDHKPLCNWGPTLLLFSLLNEASRCFKYIQALIVAEARLRMHEVFAGNDKVRSSESWESWESWPHPQARTSLMWDTAPTFTLWRHDMNDVLGIRWNPFLQLTQRITVTFAASCVMSRLFFERAWWFGFRISRLFFERAWWFGFRISRNHRLYNWIGTGWMDSLMSYHSQWMARHAVDIPLHRKNMCSNSEVWADESKSLR